MCGTFSVIFLTLLVPGQLILGLNIKPLTGTIPEGGPFTWTCSASSDSNCTYQWSRGTGAISGTISNGGTTLTFSSVNRTDAGIYTCLEFVNGTSGSNTTATLTVWYGPDDVQLTPTNATYTIIEDSPLSPVTCSHADCSPACTMHWTPTLGTTNGHVTNNGMLSFPDTSRSIAGTYSCTVTNPRTHQSKQTNVSVTVQYAPDVSINWLNAELECVAAGKPDEYTFHKWEHRIGGIKIRAVTGVGRDDNTNVLRFPNASYMDTGNYKCFVDNGVKKLGESFQIQTKAFNQIFDAPPIVVASEPNYNVSKGNSVTVIIDTYAIPPPTVAVSDMQLVPSETNVTKDIDGVDIDNTTATMNVLFHGVSVPVQGRRVQIHFSRVKEEYFGDYTITIRNEIGNKHTMISLSPQGAPDPPFNLTVKDRSETSVTIMFTSGFYNGANQSFQFYYKTSAAVQWLDGPTVHVGKVKTRTWITIHGLEPETFYMFRSHGYNIYGNSSHDNEAVNATTLVEPLPYGIIAGVSAGGAAVIVIVIVAIFLVRRHLHATSSKGQTSSLTMDMNDILEKHNPTYQNPDPARKKESVIYANTVGQMEGGNEYENTIMGQKNKRNVAVVQPLPIDGINDNEYYNVHSMKQTSDSMDKGASNCYDVVPCRNTVQSPPGTDERPVYISPQPLPAHNGESGQPTLSDTDTEDNYVAMDLSKSMKDEKVSQNTNLVQKLKNTASNKAPVRVESGDLYMDMKVHVPSSKRESVPDFVAPPPPPPPATESVYMNLQINAGKRQDTN